MRKVKHVIALCLALLLALSVTACGDGNKKEASVEVWTVSSNEKIILDKTYDAAVKTDGTLRFTGAKGEYESAQLMITPDADVQGVDLAVSALHNGSDSISADNITVYFEKYYRLDSMSSPQFPVEYGSYPDALVPLEALRSKGEDRISAGNNQGLWVTVAIPENAKAGTYSGTFTLTVGGTTKSIPVELNVWDFTMPQENHMQTIFNNFREHLMNGELDNSEAMMKFYADWLLDYHISVDKLPMFEKNAEKFVELAKEYAANPKCACYGMNLYYEVKDATLLDGTTKSINETDWDTLEEYFKALANASTPELNLFTKLNMYDQSIDEPEGTNRVPEANYKQVRINELKEKVIADLQADNFDFAAHGIVPDDIRAVEYVVTNRYMQTLKDMTTYCPLICDLNTESDRATYKALEDRSPFNTTWWYDAWQPQYPYPNFRVEEPSVGLRALCWMQMDYDIEGFLYWGTSVYSGIETNGFGAVRDPYTDPYPFRPERVTNDGMLTYPGRPYGVYGPVPSIRLMAYRDGAEDYEYLWYLRSLLGDANQAYATDFDFNSIMRSMYDSLYSGTIPNYNATALMSAREEVAGLIELLESDAKAVVTVDSIDAIANTITYSVYSLADVQVQVADAALQSTQSQGSGVKRVYEQTLSGTVNYANITFTANGKEKVFSKYLGKKTNVVALYKDSAVFTVSKGNVLNPQDHIVATNTNGGNPGLSDGTAKIEISPYTAGTPTQIAAYSPYVEIPVSAIGNMTGDKLDEFGFTLFGENCAGKKVRLLLVAGGTTYGVGEAVLAAGNNVVRFHQIYLSSWNKLAEVTAVRIVFEKAEDRTDTYYLDNVFYTANI